MPRGLVRPAAGGLQERPTLDLSATDWGGEPGTWVVRLRLPGGTWLVAFHLGLDGQLRLVNHATVEF